MKFRRKFKPSRVLANPKVERRSGLHGAHTRLESVKAIEPANGSEHEVDHLILYATNGVSMVRLDLGHPEHGDVPGPIPAPALKHMERGVSAALNEDEVRVGITRYDRVSSEANPGGGMTGWPDVDKTLAEVGRPPAKQRLFLGISPKMLSDLAAAMEAEDGVYLVLDEAHFENMTAPGREDERWYHGSVRVEAKRGDDALGLIGPIRPIGA